MEILANSSPFEELEEIELPYKTTRKPRKHKTLFEESPS
jgi:hypothetical protein